MTIPRLLPRNISSKDDLTLSRSPFLEASIMPKQRTKNITEHYHSRDLKDKPSTIEPYLLRGFLEVEEITDNLSLLSIWRNFENSIFLSSFQHRTTIKIIKIHLRTLLTLFIPLYYFVLNPAGKTRDTLRDSWKLCAAILPWSKIILLRYLPRLQDSSLWQPPTLLLMGDKKWEVLSFAHRISGKACKGN